MTVESMLPFLLIVAPFAFAFFAEALVLYFSKVKTFWASLGLSVLINLLSLVALYGSSLLLGKLGYAFNGLQLPVQVMLFFWWLSVVTEGLLLQALMPKAHRVKLYLASLAMNTVSYLFLYFFVTNSH